MKFDPIIGFPRWATDELNFKDWRELGNPNFIGFPIEFLSDDLVELFDYVVREKMFPSGTQYEITSNKDFRFHGVFYNIFDAFRRVHDLSNHDLAVESDQFDDIFGQIIELANDGMSWDGNHHKLWFFKQIRDLIPEFEDSEAIAP